MARLFSDRNNIIQYGSDSDYCILCAKKEDQKVPHRNYYDILESLKGKLSCKKVVKIYLSGIPRCICMDCIKEIYKEYVEPNEKASLSEKNSENSKDSEEVKDTEQNESEKDKKPKTNKNSKEK